MRNREAALTAQTPIASPCINVCAVDGRSGLCTGCGRRLKEIAGWSAMSEAERRAVMTELPERIASLGPKAAAPLLAAARIKSALGA
jgi:predicted Fe-S protein YdhL (DUF1289 family)